MTGGRKPGQQYVQLSWYSCAPWANPRVRNFCHRNALGWHSKFDEFLLGKAATHNDAICHRDLTLLFDDCPTGCTIAPQKRAIGVRGGSAIEVFVHGSKERQI
tara:strand:+ start:42 stop:350 length:309 start_codon:yes stop_codon:yes gene_type:complete